MIEAPWLQTLGASLSYTSGCCGWSGVCIHGVGVVHARRSMTIRTGHQY